MSLRILIAVALAIALVATPAPADEDLTRGARGHQGRQERRQGERRRRPGVEDARQQGRRGAAADARSVRRHATRPRPTGSAPRSTPSPRPRRPRAASSRPTSSKRSRRTRSSRPRRAASPTNCSSRKTPRRRRDSCPASSTTSPRTCAATPSPAELDIARTLARPTDQGRPGEALHADARQGSGRTAREEARGERRQGERHRALRLRHPRERRSARSTPRRARVIETAYPPETATDAAGTFKGKDGHGADVEAGRDDRQVRQLRPDQAARQAQGRSRLRAGRRRRGEGDAVRDPRHQPDLGQDLPERQGTAHGHDEYHHGAPFDAHRRQGHAEEGRERDRSEGLPERPEGGVGAGRGSSRCGSATTPAARCRSNRRSSSTARPRPSSSASTRTRRKTKEEKK